MENLRNNRYTFSLGTILSVLMLLMLISSNTRIYDVRYPILYLCAVIVLLYRRSISLNPSKVGFSLLLFTIWVGLSTVYSVDAGNTVKYFTVYFSFSMVLLYKYNEKIIDRTIEMLRHILPVFAFTVIITVFLKRLFIDQLHFLVVSSSSSLLTDLRRGQYSGLAGHRTEAALLMCLGLCLTWANILSSKKFKKKDAFFLILYYVCLMLTGKRMLFVVAVVVPVLVTVSILKGKKKLYIFGAILLLSGTLFVLVNRIGVLQVIINRLLDTDDYASLNSRDRLWAVSISMFKSKPLTGHGFGSFNTIANQMGVRYRNQSDLLWRYNGHNDYLEILGEVGLIGAVLYYSVWIKACYKMIKIYRLEVAKKLDRRCSMLFFFSLMVIVYLLMYAITGNPAYYVNEIAMQIFPLIIVEHLYSKCYLSKRKE